VLKSLISAVSHLLSSKVILIGVMVVFVLLARVSCLKADNIMNFILYTIYSILAAGALFFRVTYSVRNK
jgi:hypothetical protein